MKIDPQKEELIVKRGKIAGKNRWDADTTTVDRR